MSPRSSWSGTSGAAAAGGDVLDLDLYMQDSRQLSVDDYCNRLIVDAGESVALYTSSSSRQSSPSPAAPCSASRRAKWRDKRASHDSGLSEFSDRARRSKRHIGTSDANFEAFCERCELALREQGAEIARVAQMCEQIRSTSTQRRSRRSVTHTSSSDVTTSTFDTSEKIHGSHLNDKCKTFKLILNKFDNLHKELLSRALERNNAATVTETNDNAVKPVKGCNVEAGTGREVAEKCVGVSVTSFHRPRVLNTETIVNGSSQFATEATASKFEYDLNDPIKLYQQSKKMLSNVRRAYSVDASPRTQRRVLNEYKHLLNPTTYEVFEQIPTRTHSKRTTQQRDETLCSICRYYWKNMKDCVFTQLFSKLDTVSYSTKSK